MLVVFLFKQKTSDEMRISDWSSDVCSSDLGSQVGSGTGQIVATAVGTLAGAWIGSSIGRSLDERDRQTAYATDQDALETNADGESSSWSNPDNKRSDERRVGNECVGTCRSRW